MDVILLKDLESIGEKHSVVSVKNGYGRNYLIPKGLALIANESNIERLDKIKDEAAAKEASILSDIQVIADKLKGQTLKIGVKSGTSGKIFGSVTNIQIMNALKDQLGVEVDRKKISLPEEIHTIGTYTAVVEFHAEVDAKVDFELISE
jgi:large subunit ribosomal protein L9